MIDVRQTRVILGPLGVIGKRALYPRSSHTTIRALKTDMADQGFEGTITGRIRCEF